MPGGSWGRTLVASEIGGPRGALDDSPGWCWAGAAGRIEVALGDAARCWGFTIEGGIGPDGGRSDKSRDASGQ